MAAIEEEGQQVLVNRVVEFPTVPEWAQFFFTLVSLRRVAPRNPRKAARRVETPVLAVPLRPQTMPSALHLVSPGWSGS